MNIEKRNHFHVNGIKMNIGQYIHAYLYNNEHNKMKKYY